MGHAYIKTQVSNPPRLRALILHNQIVTRNQKYFISDLICLHYNNSTTIKASLMEGLLILHFIKYSDHELNDSNSVI